MADAVIEISGLTKHFGSFAALDGLDLQVPPGTIAGFLGPNGAGKSTAIRILLGLYRRDGGTARLFGADPYTDAVSLHRRLAYVPGDVTLWNHLTGGQCIDLLLGLRDVQGATRRDELLEVFELDPTKRSGTYSKGNRQKVALVAALAADVELLILDEPTSGLDPLMEARFQEQIRAARDRGTTVLLSSHILGQVQDLCDDVTIIRRGKTVLTGALSQLRHVTRSGVSALVADAIGVQEGLAAVEGVSDVTVDDTKVRFTVDDATATAAVAVLAQYGARQLVVEPPTLEQLFLSQYDQHES